MTTDTKAAKDRAQMAKWRDAHPGIDMPEASLLTAGPWPSLQLGDFIVWLETKADVEDNPDFKTVAKVLRGINREIIWTYDGWAKALHDGDPNKLLQAIMNDARAPAKGDQAGNFAFVRKFLLDYANAHGYAIDIGTEAPALDIFDQLGISFDGMTGAAVPVPVPEAAKPNGQDELVQGATQPPPAPQPDFGAPVTDPGPLGQTGHTSEPNT